MNKKHLCFLVVLATIVILGGALLPAAKAGNISCENSTGQTDYDYFGEKQISAYGFLPDFRLYNEENSGLFSAASKPEQIKALVVPHHSLAADYTREAMSLLAEGEKLPTAVILLGPNHKNLGPSSAVTTLSWQTPFGRVDCEKEIARFLISRGLTEEADELFVQEHSIGAIQPWLARYLPGVPVVPLIFHRSGTQEKIADILVVLQPWLDQGAVLIASIDFSHGLDRTGAAARDQEMTAYLKNNEYKKIARLDSSYLDGPEILAAMMQYFTDYTDLTVNILANINGGDILNYPPGMEVTSYFLLAY